MDTIKSTVGIRRELVSDASGPFGLTHKPLAELSLTPEGVSYLLEANELLFPYDLQTGQVVAQYSINSFEPFMQYVYITGLNEAPPFSKKIFTSITGLDRHLLGGRKPNNDNAGVFFYGSAASFDPVRLLGRQVNYESYGKVRDLWSLTFWLLHSEYLMVKHEVDAELAKIMPGLLVGAVFKE